ncbi:DUF4249 domain-containing protein [Algibacter sp. L3A6]|uniref:DUF4249 domain-containing protein n=1 Tax=Algibacter sp. L3A6 TaxID=2686366 RepID=UPI00131E00D8|nr:DUF4249 domain-containing protein [Algibacter sp. L3A6]
MKLNQSYTIVCLLFGLCAIFNCTEQIALSTENFEDLLVVEATITDEFKTQEIKITHTYLLESDAPIIDAGAVVQVQTANAIYNFHHVGNGVFYSDQEFQALDGETYQLLITTSDGEKYSSNPEELASKAGIENLYAERMSIGEEEGIQVFVDTNNDLNGANFFRYEYEETYKIVPEYYRVNDAVISNIVWNGRNETDSGEDRTYDIDFVDRPENQGSCYGANTSNEIIITNINSLSESRITRFPIKFISSTSSSLRDRYSILVKQYVQSATANTFYKILKELGGSSESVFVTNQPGFVQGNIFSQQNIENKVVGFFDVSTVTSKRIYFNYFDFDLVLPPYYFNCEIIELDYQKKGRLIPPQEDERSRLLELLTENNPPFKYVSRSEDVYQIVKSECGDCSTFASNIKPEFWED